MRMVPPPPPPPPPISRWPLAASTALVASPAAAAAAAAAVADDSSDGSPTTTGKRHSNGGGASSSGQEGGLPSTAPPPFLTKTYDMIDDASSDMVVSWSAKGASFVVWNPPEFARDLLPKYFKHNNFSSFVRQLNTYGFRKVDPDRWEFANEGFLRGQRHLLKNIHRRKPSAHGHSQQHSQGGSSYGEAGGVEGEIERLNRDKNVLMLELVRVRQQQQQTERELQIMGQRLHGTEQRQQHMISFLAKALQSPGFVAHLVQRSDSSNCIAGKRKRELLQAGDDDSEQGSGQIVRYDPPNNESARAKLLQFFSSPDLASKLDVPLEVLVRELLPEEDEESQEWESSRATLTEMHASSELSSLERLSSPSVVTEVSNQSPPVDLPATPPLSLVLEAKEAAAASCGLDNCTSSLATGESGGSCGQTAATTKHVTASVDSGAVGVGINDVFWERFLTGSPRSGAAETDGETDVSEVDTPDTTRGRQAAAAAAAAAVPWWAKIKERDQQLD